MAQALSPEELGALFKAIDCEPTGKLSELAKIAGLSLAEDYIGADFSNENLSEDNLSGANLSNVNLSNTNLSGTNLSKADLSGANLSNADLRGANLSYANLSHAQIDDATKLDDKWRLVWKIVNQGTEGQHLSGANLSGANLSGANLSGADLSGADLSGADLSGADLSGADLSGANLSHANLSHTNLSDANLSLANLSFANLSHTQIDDATKLDDKWRLVWENQGTEDQDLSGADLSGAGLLPTAQMNSNTPKTILFLAANPKGTTPLRLDEEVREIDAGLQRALQREHLQQLVAEACSYPAKSPRRRQRLNEIVRVVTNSGRLWRENTPYYHDALQQTWMYFCQNLERYDPTRASLITWLNKYLRSRLQDFRQQEASSKNDMTVPAPGSGTKKTTDPIDNLPTPPDIPPMLEEVRHWAETDSDGVLRNTIFRKRPEINAQVLILQRLPPETPWDTIAAEFQLTPAEAKDLHKFYSRKCLPLLRNFGLKQGYLE